MYMYVKFINAISAWLAGVLTSLSGHRILMQPIHTCTRIYIYAPASTLNMYPSYINELHVYKKLKSCAHLSVNILRY